MISVLLTAVKWSRSEKTETKLKCGKKHVDSKWKWIGVNEMTMIMAIFLVSIGILGRDSKGCLQYRAM